MIEITQQEFKQLTEYIKNNYGIHLKEEKQSLVTTRLYNVLQKAGFKNFTEYYNYIVADKSGEAVITLIDKITTNHTFFMREADHFYYFRDKVLPLLQKSIRDKDLRIWCAACSSGEESYTLAMLVDQYFDKEKMYWDSKILATDISSRVLDIAKKGIYSAERINPMPPTWKSNYFKKIDNDNYTVADKIKNEVIYRKFNLMDNVFPFRKKFHTIFCRNVMIYFDNETRTNLVNKLYDVMEDGGFFFIGHSESLNKDTTKFKYVMPGVYRKVID